MSNEQVRQPAFRLFGTHIQGDVSTSEAMSQAGLVNWNVEKHLLSDIVQPGIYANKNQYVTTRDVPNGLQVLGTVKERYQVMQNEEAFTFADYLLDGGGRWDTAGAFAGDTKVYGSMLIDENEIAVDRNGINDRVKLYLLISTSHDGSLPLQASITPVRVICQNTLNLALNMIAKSEVPQTFKVRHTTSAEMNVDIAREALGMTFKYAEDFNTLANDLFQRKVDNRIFTNIIKALYPQPSAGTGADAKRIMTRYNNTIDLIHELRVSPTNINHVDNAWGVLNTLTERLDWFRQTNNEETAAIAASGFSPTVNAQKSRILEAVLAATS